jgi:hypothetical protein
MLSILISDAIYIYSSLGFEGRVLSPRRDGVREKVRGDGQGGDGQRETVKGETVKGRR